MGHLISGSMVGLMVTSSKRTYATHCTSQVCCSQSHCPCSRLLLTSASAVDTQTFGPSELLWQMWGLILNKISFLLPSFGASPLSLDVGYLFFWWDPTFSCQWLPSSKLQFWSSRGGRWTHSSTQASSIYYMYTYISSFLDFFPT